MFNSSTDEWVAGLDVEYTTVLGQEKDLKEEERKKPADHGDLGCHGFGRRVRISGTAVM